ncbi:ubiquitin carboxyl-terminal hydrolase [Helicosporidium sp. ATCC 50920]|nr:ubiquitin carboxyl-terminal hydrolase [Helicosporidium sp. ATCC 50920]|eukprot:KDD74588.1 ubiquitin carboxyl-terminal hydrolase [Helicosporidium sp. ATCC 50920]
MAWAGDAGVPATNAATWATIESDPGVFTELLARLGVKNVQVEELYSLDESTLDSLKPIYGLIFLYKWESQSAQSAPVDRDYEHKGLFFAKQEVADACATQALLSILLNSAEVDVGAELQQFREFTMGFGPDMTGLAIGNSDLLRTAHNSFSVAHPVVLEPPADDESSEAFHFIAYVPVQGRLYEMDGTKEGPIDHGPCDQETWLSAATKEIGRRIEEHPSQGIKFNLMAMIQDRVTVLEQEARDLEALCEELRGKEGDEVEQLEHTNSLLATAQAKLHAEMERRQLWKEENERRRTDYFPAICSLLRALASEHKLPELVKLAKQKQEATARS